MNPTPVQIHSVAERMYESIRDFATIDISEMSARDMSEAFLEWKGLAMEFIEVMEIEDV
jgi:hypothetical protein